MRRLFWFGAAYAGGVATALWVRRKAQQAAQRFMPGSLGRSVSTHSRRVGSRVRSRAEHTSRHLRRRAAGLADDVRDAVAEGRAASRRTERSLR